MTIGQLGCVLPATLALYYLIAWLLVGRNRSKFSVVVRYTPPDNISPAAMRFIYTMGADGRTYTAILARLAARGLLEIVPQSSTSKTDGVMLKRAEADHRAAKFKDLPAEEKSIYKELFEWEEQVPLRRPEWRMMEKLHETLQEQVGVKFLTRHMAWVVAGLAISGAAAAWLSAITLFGKDPTDA
jgi:tRNA-dihydrouridine synthase